MDDDNRRMDSRRSDGWTTTDARWMDDNDGRTTDARRMDDAMTTDALTDGNDG